MGPDAFIAALQQGADLVIGGRSTDAGVIAASAIWKGAGLGPAWHAGETGECGGRCTAYTTRGSGVS